MGPADEICASLTHSPYFPSVFVEIDAQTGDSLQQYVHPGHLTSRIQSMDLDEDGDVELITGGYSNAFNSPVVLALHAEDLSGYALVQGRRHTKGSSPRVPASACDARARGSSGKRSGSFVARSSRRDISAVGSKTEP